LQKDKYTRNTSWLISAFPIFQLSDIPIPPASIRALKSVQRNQQKREKEKSKYTYIIEKDTLKKKILECNMSSNILPQGNR